MPVQDANQLIAVGIAKGANVSFLSILALNVRTEIAYGMSKDGCTALYWKATSSTFLAQNWDWQEEQQENLIRLVMQLPDKPSFAMITEAGIIGKIGLNSEGVGVCLNAIRALGVDFEKLPCHLALRTCLESNSRQKAITALKKAGVASACHILVADSGDAVGLECSHADIVELPTTKGILTHTNHFIKEHPVDDRLAFEDSPIRLKRIDELIHSGKDTMTRDTDVQTQDVRDMLADEQGHPTAICRSKTNDSTVFTLFNIVMNLRERIAQVVIGKPSMTEAETFALDPCAVTGITKDS